MEVTSIGAGKRSEDRILDWPDPMCAIPSALGGVSYDRRGKVVTGPQAPL